MSMPVPPFSVALGRGPLVSFTVRVSLPSLPDTTMLVIFDTLSALPLTITLAPLTLMFPVVVERLTVIVSLPAVPLTVRTPPLKDVLISRRRVSKGSISRIRRPWRRPRERDRSEGRLRRDQNRSADMACLL